MSVVAQGLIDLRDMLYQQALNYTKAEDKADDLLSETNLRALEKSHQFEEGTNLRAWLRSIMYSRFIDGCRKEKRELEMRVVLYDVQIASAQSLFGVPIEFDPQFVDAMWSLPEEWYDVFVLSDLHGLRSVEISNLLHIPVGTITSQLSRARKQLRCRLAEYAKTQGIIDDTTPYSDPATNYLHPRR